MGGYVAGGPGLQRYCARGDGSTMSSGGRHSHGRLLQQGSWCRTSTLPLNERRNCVVRDLQAPLARNIVAYLDEEDALYCAQGELGCKSTSAFLELCVEKSEELAICAYCVEAFLT